MLILAVTLAPVLAVGLYFYCRDRYEKEPLSMLLTAFFGGMAVILPVMAVEMVILAFVVGPAEPPLLKAFLQAFFEAGLIEESAKFSAFVLLIYRRREFNEPYDGILYSVMVALGFAFLENVLYVSRHETELMIYAAGTIRAFAAIFGHVLFGAVMGYYFSRTKFAAEPGKKKVFLLKGLFIPVLMHGFYNFVVFYYTALGVAFLLIGFYYSWKFVFRAITETQEQSPFRKENAG